MPDFLRDELLRNIEGLRQEMWRGFDGVNERLDKQNGRVGTLERREAAHHERITVLADSVEALDRDVVSPSHKRTAVTLSLGAGGGAAAVELAKWLFRSLHG